MRIVSLYIFFDLWAEWSEVPPRIMLNGIDIIDVDEVDTIDVSKSVKQRKKDEPRADAYDKTLCQDNKDFTNFLNRCLLLDQTYEMENIIQKVLLRAYICADDEYKKSEKFTRVIRKALQRLIDEPTKKYSHISDVSDTLKFHVKKVPRKRVNFVTLSTTSTIGKSSEDSRKRGVLNNESPKKSKKPKLDVIAVDSEGDDDLIALDNDLVAAHEIATKLFCDEGSDKANEVEVDSVLMAVDKKSDEVKFDNSMAIMKPKKNIKSDDKVKNKTKDNMKLKKSKHKLATTSRAEDVSRKNTPVKNEDTRLKESKENRFPNGKLQIRNNNNNTAIEIFDSQEIRIQDEMQIDNNDRDKIVNFDSNKMENKAIQNDKENLDANENFCDSNNKLLVPWKEIPLAEKLPNELNDAAKFERIKEIEAEIVKYKKKIADLEVAEVTEDSSVSAYVRCDRLQAHIVKLYKELCTLNDAVPVKVREVRLLHTGEGQPEGPVRRLEKYLNKQVDEDGIAPFPDYADVVRCVEKSNFKDGLGWSKTRVHKEAQALFECCGRALQKRRQQREWKDLRSQLSREEFDADPAANDPELAAKLELNRQLALKKEAVILEKFSRMEATSEKVSVQCTEDKTQDTDASDSSSDEEKAEPEKSNLNAISKMPQNDETNEETADEPVIRIKEEPYEVPIYCNFDVNIVIEISDSDSSQDSIYSDVE